MAVERLKARAVVLYSSQALNTQLLPKLLAGINCPIVIAGTCVCIHSTELVITATEIAGLTLANDPLEAHQQLDQLGLI